MAPRQLMFADKKFIFLGGVHRSGTSLLHTLLRDHPDISGLSHTGKPEDEGQHLQSIYPTAYHFGGPGRFGLHPESFMDENHHLATTANAAQIFIDWARYWDMTKTFLLEKSPPNIGRTRFLQHLFPDSRFVMILRHPISVAYATLKWCPASISALIEHTLRCYERLYEDKKHVRNLLVLRYEDLLREPYQLLHAIASFSGLPAHTYPVEIAVERNTIYQERWQRDLDCLCARQAVILQAYSDIFAERLALFGYSIDNLERLTDIAWIHKP